MKTQPQAIRPTFADFRKLLAKKRVANKPEMEVEELQRAELTDQPGWKLFEADVDELIKDLDEINEAKIAAGGTFEEIGQNYLIINLAKGVIRKALEKVHDARNARESAGGTGKWGYRP